jgi:hypothetical protein
MTEYWNQLVNLISSLNIEEVLILLFGLPLIAYSVFVITAFTYKSRPIKGPDRWYQYILIFYLLSFIWIWLSFSSVFLKWPSLIFIPINLSFLLGPMIFMFVKSKLYENFRVRKTDFKHLVIPVAHLSFYVFAFIMPIEKKAELYFGNYQLYYKPIEQASFGIIYFIYLYFAYRFIKHEQWSISETETREFRIKLEWIRRFIKILWGGAWIILTFGLFYVLNSLIFKLRFKHNYLELLSLFTYMFSMGWLGIHAVLMKVLPKNTAN